MAAAEVWKCFMGVGCWMFSRTGTRSFKPTAYDSAPTIWRGEKRPVRECGARGENAPGADTDG